MGPGTTSGVFEDLRGMGLTALPTCHSYSGNRMRSFLRGFGRGWGETLTLFLVCVSCVFCCFAYGGGSHG